MILEDNRMYHLNPLDILKKYNQESRKKNLYACHIASVINVVFDTFSRTFADHKEWALSEDIFKIICEIFFLLR